VEVSEDTEDPQTNYADEGKPQCIHLIVFGNISNYLWMFVHLRSGVEWNLRCMNPRCLCPLLVMLGR
jgi:hypothetical protein